MDLQEHKFVITCAAFTIIAWIVPPFQPVLFLIILAWFPGVCILSIIKSELDLVEGLFLPLLFGISFWIVFSYVISGLHILHWVTVVSISLFSAFLVDRKHIHIHLTGGYEVLFLMICCLFMVSYLYPWSQFYQWMPPGDDMKYHISFIESIHTDHFLPESYGPLYPELTTLSYPLGFHLIVSQALFHVSVPAVMGIILIIIPLSCFSFYFLGKTMFNSRIGLYAAFSLSFLSLFYHRLALTATFPNLLSIALQICGLLMLIKVLDSQSKAFMGISALFLAASGETHSYILLLNCMILFLFFCYFLIKNSSKAKFIACIGAAFFLLSIPYLLRLEFESLSLVELDRFTAWYVRDSFRSFSDLYKNLRLMSPLLLFCGIGGALVLKKKFLKEIFGLWVVALLIIPILSIFQVHYPGWYAVSPNRFFLLLSVPLCFLSGRFLAEIEDTIRNLKGRFSARTLLLFFVGVVILLSTGMHHFNIFGSFSPDPVTEVQMNADDEFVMEWITAYTAEDAVILNTGASADCSSWVPVLCKRRVVFPFFSDQRSDDCIEKLQTYNVLVDLKNLEFVPESNLALQVLQKYNIDYIYVPAWSKNPLLILYPDNLAKSPLYRPVIKKGEAYLFQVDYDAPSTPLFTMFEQEDILIDEISILNFDPELSPDAEGYFFFRLDYTDTVYGQFDVVVNENYIDTVYLYQTGEEKSIIFPSYGHKSIDISFHSSQLIRIDKVTALFGASNMIEINETIGLRGLWTVSSDPAHRSELPFNQIIGPADVSGLRIYLFGVNDGELVLTYEDTGYSNVDINVSDVKGEWHSIGVIYRQNSGEIKKVHIPLQGKYTVLALGVFAHESDFVLRSVEYQRVRDGHTFLGLGTHCRPV